VAQIKFRSERQHLLNKASLSSLSLSTASNENRIWIWAWVLDQPTHKNSLSILKQAQIRNAIPERLRFPFLSHNLRILTLFATVFSKRSQQRVSKKTPNIKKKKHFWGTDADNECDLMLFWPLLFLGENVQIP